MRKWPRYLALVLFVLLLTVGLCVCLHKDAGTGMEGSSAGLGLMLLEDEKGLYVLAVTKGSLAEKAGVLPGDYLIQANETLLVHSDQLNEEILADAAAMELHLMRDGEKVLVRLATK